MNRPPNYALQDDKNNQANPKLGIDQRPVSRKSRKFSGIMISGDIILFVSSKRRRLEARNFAVIFVLISFTTYEKTSLME